jgi:phosphoglycolate phosphatase-like HAD superfamily hydrolase
VSGLLLLFDIDGTLLLRATEEHRAALHAALREVHGIEPEGVRVSAAGRTDPEIARLILLSAGVDARQVDERAADQRIAACRAYAEKSGAGLDLAHTVAPGVHELLEDMASREGVALALLTGNYEPIARLKLRRAGIDRFFPAHQGGFGSDSEDRTELPAIARRRAGEAGSPWPREKTVVIGDTPRDIACARADGVRCLAIATGPHPADDLAEADAVVPDARGARRVLESWL